MGSCCDKMSASDKETLRQERARAKALDRANQLDHNADMAVNKLLLLGAGESGKSTLFKQMNTIYGKGFDEEDRKTFEPIIYNNVISSMQTLIAAAPVHGGGVRAPASAKTVESMAQDTEITSKNVALFKELWEDAGIQQAYKNRSKFQLTDSANYFFNKVDDIAADGYIPTEGDVLRSRVRTTGIVENNFEIDGNEFKIFDVGGQRNERKKWIHCFENVTAVLFVGVLSEYDLMLYEDENTNRMEETLNLFDEICNSRWFRETSIILFLNKKDLFEEKIAHTPLTACPLFASYTGPSDYENGVAKIEDLFLSHNHSPNKQVYCHVTCATDTNTMTVVFNAAKDIIIHNSLDEAGLV